MNEQNLIPTTQLTETERRDMAHRAGVASGIARRKYKTARELALQLGEDELKTQKGATITKLQAAVDAMYKAAVEGDVQAFNAILKTRGEDIQKLELSAVPNPVNLQDDGLSEI